MVIYLCVAASVAAPAHRRTWATMSGDDDGAVFISGVVCGGEEMMMI